MSIERRDRPWLSSTVGALCGPFDMPSVEALEDALVELSERHPSSRLTWGVNDSRTKWQIDAPRDAVRHRKMVVEREIGDDPDFGRVLDAIVVDDALAWPLALIRYERYLGLRMSHGVGDGRMFNRVLSTVMQTAITGEVAPWTAEPARRSPLLAGIRHTFGKAPNRFRAAVADRPAAVQRPTPGERRAWSAARVTEHVTLAPATAKEIAAWGKQHAPGSSKFALQVVLLLRSFAAVGIAVDPEVSLVFDLRRYLKFDGVDGNFVIGVPVHIDVDSSPNDVSGILRATAESGRPLATQSMSTVALMRTGATVPTVDAVDSTALPRMTFSSLGRPADIDALPFSDRDASIYIGSVEPDGPLGVTALIIETVGGVNITVSFHDNVVDRALVRRATDLVRADPIGVLAVRGVSR